jgi:hypothetical protein
MGLDGIELILAFEEAFGVEFTDQDAEQIRTPGDVVRFVLSKRGAAKAEICISQRAFFRVRKILCANGVLRSALRPETRLDSIFSAQGRSEKWEQCRGDISQLRWPNLVRPNWLARLLTVLVIAAAACAALTFSDGMEAVLATIFIAIPFGLFARRLTKRFAVCFPEMSTIGDLARSVAMGTKGLLADNEALDRATVSKMVKQIVMNQIGIRESQYGEEKQFVRDLGVD